MIEGLLGRLEGAVPGLAKEGFKLSPIQVRDVAVLVGKEPETALVWCSTAHPLGVVRAMPPRLHPRTDLSV